MFLSESYKSRLLELSGIVLPDISAILNEVENLYKNSNKRVKFDMNLMKQAIEGGMEIGLIFQSNNEKYKMPIWKTRVVQPVVLGYGKKGDLVVRGIHVEGQSEKKAIETGVRSAQAKNEWRLFKVSNIKSMFFTGRLFTKLSLAGYNPNDSAMSDIIISFNPEVAKQYQNKLNINKKSTPVTPVEKPLPIQKAVDKTLEPKPTDNSVKKAVNKPEKNNSDQINKLQQKIDKLNKLL